MSTSTPSDSVLVETPRGHTREAHVVSAELIATISDLDERLTVDVDGVELCVLASDLR
ncbi:hypothetical protein ACFQJC_05075 [Haloferax namakaokahaiae]|uniref:STAS domain-containing protein n=1 Tax=Haloferax namakaokahaiae TaxID=1748331 RepID=A0ABD5ZCD4_9EURY